MSLLVHEFIGSKVCEFISCEFMSFWVHKQVLALLVHAFVYSSV